MTDDPGVGSHHSPVFPRSVSPLRHFSVFIIAAEKATHSWKVKLICFMWDILINSDKRRRGSHWGWLPCDCISHTHSLAADGSVKCHPLGLPAWPHVVPAMHFCYATQFNDGRGGRAPYSEGNWQLGGWRSELNATPRWIKTLRREAGSQS